MIEIRITDPHLLPKKELHNLGVYLLAMTGHAVTEAPPPPAPVTQYCEPVTIPVCSTNTGALNDADPIQCGDLEAGETYNVDLSKCLPDGTVTRSAVTLGTEVDSQGYPWDARIHTEARTFIQKDGSWKLKRGVDPALVTKVRNEFGTAMAAPPPPNDVQPIFGNHKSAAVPPPPVAPASMDFNDLVKIVGSAFATQKVSQAQVVVLLTELGLPSLPALQSRQDLIPYFHTRFMHLLEKAA